MVEVSEFECDELHNEVGAKEKDTALHMALSWLAGDFGRESMLSLQRFFSSRRLPVISTGSLKLDIALGIGGLPKGRIVEIYGQEASGKTTLAFHIIKEAQKLGVEVSEFECDELHNEVGAKEKDTALHIALSRLAGDFGRESMLSLQRFFSSRRLPVISTGSLKLDIALGIGGLPKGRIVEIYGQEASGKTTLAFHIIKEAQKLGGYCAYLDVENAMDPSLAEAIGVNTENLLISQPDSAENLLCMVDTLTKSGSVDVIVVDSVAALVPQHELDVLVGDNYKDMQSQIMTQALRKIRYSLCQSQTIIIFVNQVRSNIKSVKGFGHAEEVTCGGNALPFHAAIRMRISRTGLVKSGDKVTGLRISVQVVKNKLSPLMKKAELAIHFGRGINCESEVLDLACEHGVIVEEGNNFFIEGDVLTYRLEAERYLAENDAVFDNVVKSLRRQLFEGEA